MDRSVTISYKGTLSNAMKNRYNDPPERGEMTILLENIDEVRVWDEGAWVKAFGETFFITRKPAKQLVALWMEARQCK